jgi:hypothetical protein
MIFNGATVVLWVYKGLLVFFVGLFLRNMFQKEATLTEQFLSAFVLFPFVLRLFSVR